MRRIAKIEGRIQYFYYYLKKIANTTQFQRDNSVDTEEIEKVCRSLTWN